LTDGEQAREGVSLRRLQSLTHPSPTPSLTAPASSSSSSSSWFPPTTQASATPTTSAWAPPRRRGRHPAFTPAVAFKSLEAAEREPLLDLSFTLALMPESSDASTTTSARRPPSHHWPPQPQPESGRSSPWCGGGGQSQRPPSDEVRQQLLPTFARTRSHRRAGSFQPQPTGEREGSCHRQCLCKGSLVPSGADCSGRRQGEKRALWRWRRRRRPRPVSSSTSVRRNAHTRPSAVVARRYSSSIQNQTTDEGFTEYTRRKKWIAENSVDVRTHQNDGGKGKQRRTR